MSRNQAYVNFYASYCGKIPQMHDSDIFQLKIRIADKNYLFATLLKTLVFLPMLAHSAVWIFPRLQIVQEVDILAGLFAVKVSKPARMPSAYPI